MGLSLGATLGRVLPVTIVVRDPERAATISASGIRATGLIEASSHPQVVSSIDGLGGCGPFDAVFVATKTTATRHVAQELRQILPELGEADALPFVISFQNGIESGRELMDLLAHDRVLRMVLNYGATQTGPRSARVMLHTPPHYIGGPCGRFVSSSQPIANDLCAGGLPTRAVPDIEPMVWLKGIINAAMNPVAALMNASVGEVLDSPAKQIVRKLLAESCAVARAACIDLPGDIEDRLWSILDSARKHTPSMVGDIRAGLPSEVGQLNQQILDRGGQIGVPTPTHEMITALIDAFDWRAYQRNQKLQEQRPRFVHGAVLSEPE